MKIKKNFIVILFLIVFTTLFCTSCNKETGSEEKSSEISTTNEPAIEEKTELQKISEQVNIPIFEDFMNEIYEKTRNYFTIDIQRSIKDKTFLKSYWYFDIIEENGKVYLRDNDYGLEVIELTEEQAKEILSTPNVSEVICSVHIKNVTPIDAYFYADFEVDNSYKDSEYPDMREYIEPYTQISSGQFVIRGTCEKIHKIIVETDEG